VHIIFHPENEMKKFINVYIKSDYDIVILRLSVIIIFILFGTYKWFDFEVMALKPLISPTWLNILYIMFGVQWGELFPRHSRNYHFSSTEYRLLQACCWHTGRYYRYCYRFSHTKSVTTTGKS